jgi:hypothetical protein
VGQVDRETNRERDSLVLHEHVCIFYQPMNDLLCLFGLQIQRQSAVRQLDPSHSSISHDC